MLVMVLLAVGCPYDAGGLGTSSQSTGGESSSTTAGGDGPSPSSTSTGSVDGGTTTGGSTSSSSSGGGSGSSGSSGSSTGPDVPMLIDEGLLARWYLDEAASGMAPSAVIDHQPPAVDLPLVYDADQPRYDVVDDSRGLVWSATQLSGRAVLDIAGTKFESELTGATQATFEIVLSVEEVTTDLSRFIHFGDGAGGGDFAIGSPFLDRIVLRWGGSTLREFESDFGGTDRRVLHVVVDTDAGAPDDRLRAYLDGMRLPLTNPGAPGQGEGLPLDQNSALALGNRSDGTRSFRGHLQYAAIYTEVLDQAQLEHNVDVLLASDDAP